MNRSFELLDLEKHERNLITLVQPETNRFYLSPLDKGLSGARALIVQWALDGDIRSAHHVVKIGPGKKLVREYEAIKQIKSLLPRLGAIRLLPPATTPSDHRLLLQEYAGGETAVPVSMRQRMGPQVAGAIDGPSANIEEASALVDRVFRLALKNVHFQDPKHYARKRETYSTALDWWLDKGGDIGSSSIRREFLLIESRLRAHGLPSWSNIDDLIKKLKDETDEFAHGYVHGDLHTQNILVDPEGKPHLIDFAWAAKKWRAVDFLMLECSLKFVCSPFDAHIDDLLSMETVIDQSMCVADLEAWASQLPLGLELAPIAAAAIQARHLAIETGAVKSNAQYRKGLTLLTSALADRPGLNRSFLMYSLAYQTQKIMDADDA